MSEPRFCYRHPTRIAKRKCFQCGRPLCPQCQLKLDHHLFCSELCHKNLQTKTQEPPVVRPYRRYAVYAASLVLFSGLIYFALFADAFYSTNEKPSQKGLADLTPSLPVSIQTEQPPPPDSVTITRPANGMKSASQTIEVEGKAPANSVVAMYLNGTLMESTVAHDSDFRFSNVLLTKHANVIQTRYYSSQGSSNFSPAIMVFYQDPIPTQSGDFRFFQNSPDNISRGNLSRKELVLSFDGGSDEASSCERILQILDQYHVRSTIFLTGEFIQNFPELTRKIAATQEVGNHTFSHEHLTTFAEDSRQNTAPAITREELQDQLKRTEDIFYRTTGRRMSPLWRAPYGEHNLEIRRWASELGYTHVAWTSDPRTRQNMDSLDWVPDARTAGYFPAMVIKDRLLSFGQNEPEQANGAIVLMHLGTQRVASDQLVNYLPEIVKTFTQRGYHFITASELIDHQDLLPVVAQK